MRDTNSRTRRRGPRPSLEDPCEFPSRSMVAAKRATRSEYEQRDYDIWDGIVENEPDGCQPGCSAGCSNGAEAVMSLSEVVTELFELINEVAFPEVIDVAKKEKPKTTFDDVTTYKEDEDTMFMQTNEYNTIKKAQVFLGFIGHVETNVTQNLPTALERPSFEMPLSKSSLFGMLSQEEDEPELEGRDDHYEKGRTQHHGEHDDSSVAKTNSERILPLNPDDQSNAEGSINENKSDLTDERSESELEGKYKTYIKTTMSSTEAHGQPCLSIEDDQSELLSVVESNDQGMQIFGAERDRNPEQKEVREPNYAPTEVKPLDHTDRKEKSLNPGCSGYNKADGRNDVCLSASEDHSFIELEDESITYSIGHMDSALQESVTYHSRDSVTSHTKDSALEESVTYHSRESEFDESVTFHTKDSGLEESVTYHSRDSVTSHTKDSALEESVTYHSRESAFDESVTSHTKDSALEESVTSHTKDIVLEDSAIFHSKYISIEETDHSNSYEEEESYESVTDYDEESYESVTKLTISVVSNADEFSEEEKSTTEEPEKLVEKDISTPEEAKKNETPQLCSIYDNLYPKDSLFSFVTKDESGSLFDFDESTPSSENEKLKPPTSVIVHNKSTEVNLDDGDPMQDEHGHDRNKEGDDHEHVNGMVEERDGTEVQQKEESTVSKPRASKLASSNVKTKETINAPKIRDTLQTGVRKTQLKAETSNSDRSNDSQESTKVLDKNERTIPKRNTSSRRKIPSRVKKYHQHRRNILKMQHKTE